MSISFTFTPNNPNETVLLAKSNYFQQPMVSYIILNVLNIQNNNSIHGTILVTDGFNNIGTITFFNYTGSFNPLKSYQGTFTFYITASTGIFSSYINGTIIIDASWGKTSTLYVFKN